MRRRERDAANVSSGFPTPVSGKKMKQFGSAVHNKTNAARD